MPWWAEFFQSGYNPAFKELNINIRDYKQKGNCEEYLQKGMYRTGWEPFRIQIPH